MSQHNLLVPLTLWAFPAIVVLLFSHVGPRRAVVASLLGGWLFLPFFDDRYSFIFVHVKAAFVPGIVIAVSSLLDGARWTRFRPTIADIPIAVLCLTPFLTSLDNDLGLKEATASSLEISMIWGAPYLLGRLYLSSPEKLGAYARALIVAALVYVPFCLWEIRMSPQLRHDVYGLGHSGFDQVIRYGGYRPIVFMQHGLAVSMFMATGTIAAYWTWRTRACAQVAGVPLSWATALLALTTVLCKSTAAIVLLGAGIAVLEATRRARSGAIVLALAIIPVAYTGARVAGWSGDTVVALSARVLKEDRVASLRFRMANEYLLIEKALQRRWIGWGRFGRALVYDEGGVSRSVLDGRWIIAFGTTGLVGLAAMGAVLIIPPLTVMRRFPAGRWSQPRLAAVAALAVALLLWAIDEILNSMLSPVFPAIAGALVSNALLPAGRAVGRTLRPAPTPMPPPRRMPTPRGEVSE